MTPQERLRKHQRALEKTMRELDRERIKLENQEKKTIAEIKKNAKNGQMGAAKIGAKDLVRTRRSVSQCSAPRGAIAHLLRGTSRLRTVLQIYREVLLDEDAAASYLFAHTDRAVK